MDISRRPEWSEFVKTFNNIARYNHRYEVFRDFVTVSAIAMHNGIHKDPDLEAEYLRIVGGYEKSDVDLFCQLLAKLVMLLDSEPYDVLGALYMGLELGSTHTGQFFTPPELSELMARLSYGDFLRKLPGPFITVSEPACGAGGMILAFVKVMIEHGHNPAETMWVQCQDVDRLAALMCYLQISLWNIPGVVIVGNTLSCEAREVFYTPQHHLGLWSVKLRHRRMEEAKSAAEIPQKQIATPIAAESQPARPAQPELPIAVPAGDGPMQFDLGF